MSTYKAWICADGSETLFPHTSVIVQLSLENSHAYGCFGSDIPDDPVRASGYALSDSVSIYRAEYLTKILKYTNETKAIPLYSGITYAVGGVCHQAANRVMFALGIGILSPFRQTQISIPELESSKCPAYTWSKIFYGRYGRSYPKFSTIIQEVIRRYPYPANRHQQLMDRFISENSEEENTDSSNSTMLHNSLPTAVFQGFVRHRHTRNPRMYSKRQKIRVAEVIRGARTCIDALQPVFSFLGTRARQDRLLQLVIQRTAPRIALLVRDRDFGRQLMQSYRTPILIRGVTMKKYNRETRVKRIVKR